VHSDACDHEHEDELADKPDLYEAEAADVAEADAPQPDDPERTP
jgi:hypothetical protein